MSDHSTSGEDPPKATDDIPGQGRSPKGSAAAPPLSQLGDYQILREIGRGGMGVVYRARDRRRNQVVALKTMQRFDPAALYRFKQEFRSLAGLSHPNLAALYDLAAEGDLWYFTMEFIDGVNFLVHVRSAEQLADPEVTASALASAAGGRPPSPPLAPHHTQRLRRALLQLASGINFLHQSRRLHRDIKPSNVLVASGERVVVVDFGLAAELDRGGIHESTEQHIAGTVAYMAPEQGAGGPVTPAADWYSIGVMLYEALTGRRPYSGRPLQVLQDKQHKDPPAPREMAPDVPEDLNALCMELLCRKPDGRPSGREVLKRLGEESAPSAAAPVVPPAPGQRLPLIGRGQHLALLREAFAAVQGGTPVLFYVHGPSGMGKSALVLHFLDELLERRAAVVLAGRCYEQESVPYKALDSLVDALSRYLAGLPALEAQALLPRDVETLARVFPVLRQVEAVCNAPPRRAEIPDPQELRRRAFGALRELLARLGDRRPLVLFIDDLQWGDVDSAALLSELVRPPDPPVLLLLGSYRSEQADRSKCLQALFQGQAAMPLDRRELAVGPLTSEEARDVALALLGEDTPDRLARAEAVGRECGGSPFFVYELVQSLEAGGNEKAGPAAAAVALEEVLWARIGRLSAAARRLLEATAVAGRPVPQATVCSVAGGADRAALDALHKGRLVRSTGLADDDEVETYHDRIRETVVSQLAAAAVTDYHRRWAGVLEQSGRADPEVLGIHYQASGDRQRGGECYARAAEQAFEALAFDRAAKLYRQALELCPASPESRRLRIGLADALANAGRGAEAAREYLGAQDEGDPAQALEMHERAARQFLISGHVDDGVRSLRMVLGAIGLSYPATPRRALVSLLFRRAVLWLRGLHFKARDASAIPSGDLRRLELLWSATIGLSMVDTVRGAHLHARYFLSALRVGEPSRVARALAAGAAYLAAFGQSGRRRAARDLAIADRIVQDQADPYGAGFVTLIRGMIAFADDRFRESVDLCRRADDILRDHCIGVWWERDTAQSIQVTSLYHLGELVELHRVLPPLLSDAQQRGDRYALTTALGSNIRPFLRLAHDEPERARQELAELLGQWSQQGFHHQHCSGMYRQVEIELYAGDVSAADELASKLWTAFTGSLVIRRQYLRVIVRHVCARAALAAASTADASACLGRAESHVRRLQREKTARSEALARLVGAGIAFARRDRHLAERLMRVGAEQLDAIEMRLYAAAARRRLGQLLGEDQGRGMIVQADVWMTGQGIKNPARMTAMLVPGFPD
jgi:hypothetical protein